MSQRYNFFYFEAEFKKYLVAGNAGASTVKNYLSDLHFFFSWIKSTLSISELAYSELPEVFSHSLLRRYYSYLSTSTKADNTVSRRISTVRKFFRLCMDQQWLTSNPVDQFDVATKRDENEDTISLYKEYLQSKNGASFDVERHINVARALIINSNIL